MRLGDLDRSDRGRKVRPGTHPIPDPVQVVPEISLELLQALLIHTRRTLVGLHLPPHLPHQQPGNRKRLLLQPWFAHFALLPGTRRPRLNDMDNPDQPAPSLHPHPSSRSFTTTTGRSAGERRDRYSMPPVSAVGTLPLATPKTQRPQGTTLSNARLLTFRARAADQAHAASTPGTTWPILGHPPGSSRDSNFAPVSMPPMN